MINPEAKVVFVRNPKTASQSIQRSLWGRHGVRPDYILNLDHLPSKEIAARHPDYWHSCFKFTCIRHPVDRAISMYHYLKRQKPRLDLGRFEDWARRDFPHTEEVWINEHRSGYGVLEQTQYVQGVDFVLRFENIETDFQRLCEAIGTEPRELQLCNVSDRDRNGFSEVGSTDLVRLLNQKFRFEYQLFGYQELPEYRYLESTRQGLSHEQGGNGLRDALSPDNLGVTSNQDLGTPALYPEGTTGTSNGEIDVIRLTLYLSGTDPLEFHCSASDPILVKLFEAVFRKGLERGDDEVMYLQTGGRNPGALYFHRSQIVAIETDPPMSPEFFAGLAIS